MNDSAAKATTLPILALAALLAAAPALAQTAPAPAARPQPGQPAGTPPAGAQPPANVPMRLVPLGPPGQAVPQPGAIPSGPPQGLVRPDTALPAAASGARAPAGVQVEALGALSADAGGILDPGAGGFGPDMWRGTPRALVDRLLPLLPAAVPSAAQRELTRRLLLSSTAPPVGEGAGRGLAGQRLERLARMGDPAAAPFAAALPVALDDEDAARAWTARELLAGDAAGACAQVPKLLGRFRGAEWQKWQIACQVRAGETAGITLGIDLLREQGEKDDLFFRLAEGAAAGVKAPVKGVAEPTPPQLALIVASGRGLQADVTASDPAALAAIALSAETPATARIAAAERAATLGALTGPQLAQVYAFAAIAEADLKAAASVAPKREGAAARALLVRALSAETSPAAKAELLRLAVEKADTAMLTGGYGENLAQEVGQLPPGAGFGFVAPHAARVLLLQGRRDLARPWVEISRNEAGFVQLWPIAALHGLIRAAEVDQTAWANALKVEDDAAARARAGAVLALLVAAGEPVDAMVRARTIGGNAGTPPLNPDVALWYRLEDAALANRIGETVLTGLLILGDAGAAGAHPLAAAHVTAYLTAAGLREEARRVAAEAAAALLPP